MLNSFNLNQLQTVKAVLNVCLSSGVDNILSVINSIDDKLSKYSSNISPANRRRPDNIIKCKLCGSPAVIVPLPPGDRTPTATHAIQCQNRPVTDQPWCDGMCGHTEYIVRGER